MNPAPNIYADTHGYRVAIERPDITYRAFIRYRAESEQGARHAIPATADEKSAALAKAIAIRDQFLAAHANHIRSNTGHTGISETVKWSAGRPHNSFQATAGRKSRARFYFRDLASRETALNKALAWRESRVAAPLASAAN